MFIEYIVININLINNFNGLLMTYFKFKIRNNKT